MRRSPSRRRVCRPLAEQAEVCVLATVEAGEDLLQLRLLTLPKDGPAFLDLRRWRLRADGSLHPSPSGVTFPLSAAEALAPAFHEAHGLDAFRHWKRAQAAELSDDIHPAPATAARKKEPEPS